MEADSERVPTLIAVGWGTALVGLSFAVTVGNGSELPRLALILPWMMLGAFCCSASFKGSYVGWSVMGISCVAAYLLLRGWMSPVWDLARRDLFLIVSGLLAFVAASSSLRFRTCRRFFIGVIVLLTIGNGVMSISQLNDGGVSFLRGRRADQLGVSGFYYHRNYLAGFLEIAFPVLVAFCVSRKRLLSVLHMSGYVLGCALLCFLTNSRGGFGVLVVGGLVAFTLERLRSVGLGGRLQGPKKKGVVLLSIILGSLLMLGGGSYLLQKILGNRSGSVSGALGDRLGMVGVAHDIWLQNPLFGMGAESYSYLFPKFFSGLGGWSGDAEMAHSDYLQLLSDYGIIGLILVLCLIGGFGFLLLRSEEESTAEVDGAWLRSAAVGVLSAEVLRAVFDFNLHLAPNLILFAMVLAGGLGSRTSSASHRKKESSSGLSRRMGSQVMVLFLLLGVGGYGIWAGFREIVHVGSWVEVEKLRFRGEDTSSALRIYSERAPSFDVLRAVARNSLVEAAVIESNKEDRYVQPQKDWAKVVERHPLDGESLANYARCLDENKHFGKAEDYHMQALVAVSRRENKYGVIYGVGWHLVKRGEEALGSRRSGEALFLFQEAEEAFELSYQRSYFPTTLNQSALEWTRGRIDFLEGARIEPSKVSFFDDWLAFVD